MTKEEIVELIIREAGINSLDVNLDILGEDYRQALISNDEFMRGLGYISGQIVQHGQLLNVEEVITNSFALFELGYIFAKIEEKCKTNIH